ncbi:MAG TPA: tetratricopeptide repeat protein [Longimicrobiales bacterium]|nr:tetratricopeptide repeat protein [Longimicrobiales bacterium]
MTLRSTVIALTLLLTAGGLSAQDPHHGPGAHGHHAQSHQLGTVHFPNSGAAAAQEAFLRGIALLHSFEYEDAQDALREAQAVDPDFALAYWADALSHTQLLWGWDDAAAARRALERLGPTPEARLARAPTARERAWGAAVEAFYADADVRTRARAFADSLRSLAAREPGDLEAAAFASLALQMAGSVGGIQESERVAAREEAIALAERVFRANRDHPGAAHYLIHVYDDPEIAHRGLEVARAYAEIAPDAQHALHMPSHIFVQVGFWDDVVASNERAWAASRDWVARRGEPGLVPDFHSLEWLHHGYLQQGRFRAAAALLDTVRVALAADDQSGSVNAMFVEPRLTFRHAAETGDWGLPLTRAEIGHAAAVSPAYADRFAYFSLVDAYQAAVGAILQGDTSSSSHDALRSLLAERGPADRGYAALMPMHVEALLARARGDLDGAIEIMTRAAVVDDAISPVGPPAALPTLEWLGMILMEAGRPAEAANAYERALVRWPKRSASLLGLARARAALGAADAAAESYSALLDNWRNADEDIAALVEARRGAANATP